MPDGKEFRLRIPGTEDTTAPMRETKSINITRSRTFRISAARAGTARPAEHVPKPDEVVEIEFEDGARVWTSPQRLCSELIPPQERKRSADGAFELPAGLAREGAARGIYGKILFKSLSFLGVDVAGSTAKMIAEKWEKHTLGRETGERGPGLYRCATEGSFKLTWCNPDDPKLPVDRPVLLFLHGTASSSGGSFGGLWEPEKIDLRRKLFAPYQHVLALQHATLSTTPVQNAIDLVKALNDVLLPGARIHLVSHSRGGLVGELLCRVMVEGVREPFTTDELEWFRKKDPEGLRGDLGELNDLMKKRPFQVERFVRVACPAWGTTLASNRLDIYLSVLFNLLGKAPLDALPGAGVVYDIFSELVMLVAKEGSDPSVLPGIESMVPGSPLVQLLNRPDCKLGGELRVIAGDIEGESFLSTLSTLVTDPLFRNDNDLVVDTDAMFGGADRSQGSAFSFHHGSQVSHFRYFKNDESVNRLLKALTRGPNELDGFEPFKMLKSDQEPPPYKRDAAGPRPVVFLLPGFMGSHLAAGGDRVWLNPDAIAFGKLEELHIDAPGVKPLEPVWISYGKLVTHLSSSHEVIPFAYDWRLSLKNEAERLAAEVDKALLRAEKTEQPVSIIAHSTGGLLARAMIGAHPSTWEKLCGHREGRLIMLGTPNSGSYAAAQLLTGRHSLVKQLALLDMKHDEAELLEIFRCWPGLLELLPEELLDPEKWESLRKSDPRRDRWQAPIPAGLKNALEVRNAIPKCARDARLLYVAGRAPATPSSLTEGRDDDGKECLVFRATAEGDGLSTWETGIPEGVKTWYVNAAHGDLANHEESFCAIQDLLQKGNTARLEQAPPVSRGMKGEFPMPEEQAPLYTRFRDLSRTALGGAPRPRREKAVRRVRVSVSHGNLAFTSNPILVGHYQGDTIASAEAHLDRIMNGRLRARHGMELYPGKDDTAEAFLNPKRQPGGAIIIGLGEVGKLSPGKLMRAVSRGVRAYAIALIESCAVPNPTRPPTGIAALLVGTTAGGISLQYSVTAILRGVAHALESLQEQDLDERVVIEELEFIELFEDRAIQTVHALDRVRSDPEVNRSFLIDAALKVKTLTGGLRRAFYAEEESWWQRLEITENPSGSLGFNVLTDRARAESYLQQSQRSLAEQFIKEIVASPGNTSDEVAVTLFEMLVPNDIKENAPDRRDVVLVLNKDAARYPWEMMREKPRQVHGGKEGKATKPISVQAGMIRQLQVEQFRERVVMARGNAALVIGNPPTAFVDLPGAAGEAQQVHTLLKNGGYAPVGLIGAEATGSAIMKALYAEDYRIVHLAGHGVYEYLEECAVPCDCCGADKIVNKVSGMVIGEGQYLTPAQLSQMRAVPELVFVNCCHLGKIEKTDGKLPKNYPPKLAANIATQLIEMGVKAVVAAGWEVVDDTAQLFASVFYTEMLAGVPFGQAVFRARNAIYDAFPTVNTWGAYQCYGDHAFCLSHTATKASTSHDKQRYAAPIEVVIRLENITQQAGTADDELLVELEAEVAAIDERIPTEWRAGAILAALGRAYGELHKFEKAVKCYKKALRDEKAPYPVRTIEQLWNFQARWAVELGKRAPDRARCKIKMAEKRLIALNETIGESAERLSLLGSTAKREAMLATTSEGKREALNKMAGYYGRAYKHGKKCDPYPYTNELTATVLLSVFNAAGTVAEDTLRAIKKERQAALDRQQCAPDFWSAVIPADYLLLNHLATRELADHVDDIVTGYREVKSCIGSPREFRSVIEHLDFLMNVIDVAPEEVKGRLKDPLEKIRNELSLDHRP